MVGILLPGTVAADSTVAITAHSRVRVSRSFAILCISGEREREGCDELRERSSWLMYPQEGDRMMADVWTLWIALSFIAICSTGRHQGRNIAT